MGIGFLVLGGIVSPSLHAKGFLRTQGQDMVDETGQKILLRGVGLGNWLLPEGYMWKFGENGDRPRKIEKLVSDLIGRENAEKFWIEFRKNYITENDIQRIAELGFNSVRPALNARRFLTEDENPAWIDEGFQLLDHLIQWCKKYDIYVIIDMHGAPGGQTGANIDDSPNDQPELFMDKKFEERLLLLWNRIAERYKDEPTVAAYDLLNEPLPKRTGADRYNSLLEPLYRRITESIRKIDPKHMITLEGADWANDWSVFSKPFDSNVFYQFHYYCWDRPDNLRSIESYLTLRTQLDTPIWVGETGEKENTIYWGTFQYFETHNVGWSFWPWKKMDTTNTPYSIRMPKNWDAICDYSRGGNKPAPEIAQKAFEELLENIQLKNCEYYPDVINAIFRRIPGIIEAENYGHLGLGKSYFVHDPSRKSPYYRTAEPVPIQLIETPEKRWSSQQYIQLQEGEWTRYEAHSLETKTAKVTLKLKAHPIPASLLVYIDGKEQSIDISSEDWQEFSLGEFEIPKGLIQMQIRSTHSGIDVDWIRID